MHAIGVSQPQVLPDVGPCKDEVFVDVAFEGVLGDLATEMRHVSMSNIIWRFP